MNNTSKSIPFTPEKYREMEIEVIKLEKLREEVMERLVTARSMGDLSENGAYKYAKFELGNIGRQLKRFKQLLVKGFPAPKKTGTKGLIDFGSTVLIEKQDDKKLRNTFMIVSEYESDPSKGKLAYSSPMGKAMMRKKSGDVFIVETPKGIVNYLIIEVS